MVGNILEALYARTRRQGHWGQIWAALSGHSQRLLSLSAVERQGILSRTRAGLQTVRLDQIQGSADRCNDFDRAFHPLQDHSKQRWLSIARARQEGKCLPPVNLVQVGETYYCLDGHHRLSVACAFQQSDVEATVTVWQVEVPQSAQSPTSTPQRHAYKGRPAGRRQSLRRLLPVGH